MIGIERIEIEINLVDNKTDKQIRKEQYIKFLLLLLLS